MNEKDSEVKHVKVSDRDGVAPHTFLRHKAGTRVQNRRRKFVARSQSRQAVRPRHQPVAQVVNVARGAPPSGRQQTRARGGLDVLEVRDSGVFGVCAEAVLFVVDAAEDVVAQALDSEDREHVGGAQDYGVHAEVASLDRVREGHPDEVAEGQHEAEAVVDDVDGGEDGRLHPQGVEDIDSLGDGDDNCS